MKKNIKRGQSSDKAVSHSLKKGAQAATALLLSGGTVAGTLALTGSNAFAFTNNGGGGGGGIGGQGGSNPTPPAPTVAPTGSTVSLAWKNPAVNSTNLSDTFTVTVTSPGAAGYSGNVGVTFASGSTSGGVNNPLFLVDTATKAIVTPDSNGVYHVAVTAGQPQGTGPSQTVTSTGTFVAYFGNATQQDAALPYTGILTATATLNEQGATPSSTQQVSSTPANVEFGLQAGEGGTATLGITNNPDGSYTADVSWSIPTKTYQYNINGSTETVTYSYDGQSGAGATVSIYALNPSSAGSPTLVAGPETFSGTSASINIAADNTQLAQGGLFYAVVQPQMAEGVNGNPKGDIAQFYDVPAPSTPMFFNVNPHAVGVSKSTTSVTSSFTSSGGVQSTLTFSGLTPSQLDALSQEDITLEGYWVYLSSPAGATNPEPVQQPYFIKASDAEPYTHTFATQDGVSYVAHVIPLLNNAAGGDYWGSDTAVTFTASPSANLNNPSISAITPVPDGNGQATIATVNALAPAAPGNGATLSALYINLLDPTTGAVVQSHEVAGPQDNTTVNPGGGYATTFTGLTPSYQYEVEVVATYNLPTNPGGQTPSTTAAQTFTESLPTATAPKVSGFAVTPQLDSSGNGTEAVATWMTPVAPAHYSLKSYEISVYNNNDQLVQVLPVSAGATSATIPGLLPNTKYTAYISASYVYGTSPVAELVSANAGAKFATYGSFPAPTVSQSSLQVSTVQVGTAAPTADISFSWEPGVATNVPTGTPQGYVVHLIDHTTGMTYTETYGAGTTGWQMAAFNGIAFNDSVTIQATENWLVDGNTVSVSSSPLNFNVTSNLAQTPLPAPNLNAATPETASGGAVTNMKVTWEGPSSAVPGGYSLANYVVNLYSVTNGNVATTPTFSDTVSGGTTSVVFSGLDAGGTYKVELFALYHDSSSTSSGAPLYVEAAGSPTVTEATTVSLPAPSTVSATPMYDSTGQGTEAQITWSTVGSVDGYSPSSYTIVVVPAAGGASQTITTTGAAQSSLLVTGLQGATDYNFSVRANFTYGGSSQVSSGPSTSSIFTTLTSLPTPSESGTPTVTSVVQGGATTASPEVTFGWNPVSASSQAGATLTGYTVLLTDSTTNVTYTEQFPASVTGLQESSFANGINTGDSLTFVVEANWSILGSSTPIMTSSAPYDYTVSTQVSSASQLPAPFISGAIPETSSTGKVTDMKVTWTGPSEVPPAGYAVKNYIVQVFRQTSSAETLVQSSTVGATATETTFSGLSQGDTYVVKVFALYSYSGTSTSPEPLLVRAANTQTVVEQVQVKLPSPTAVSAQPTYDQAGQGTEAVISWTPVQAVDGYNPVSYNVIAESESGGPVQVLNVPASQSSVVLSNLQPGTVYFYAVQANFEYGSSTGVVSGPYSDEFGTKSFMTLSALPAPTVNDIVFNTASNTSILADVKWQDVNLDGLNAPSSSVSYQVQLAVGNQAPVTIMTSGGSSGASENTLFGEPQVHLAAGDIVTATVTATYQYEVNNVLQTETISSTTKTVQVSAGAIHLPAPGALQVSSALDSSGNATLANANFEAPVTATPQGWALKGYQVIAVPTSGNTVYGSFYLGSTSAMTGNISSYSCSAITGACQFQMNGLTSGMTYTMYVEGIYNNTTTGVPQLGDATFATVTETANVPNSPTITSVSAQPGDVQVMWMPGADGGSPITHYSLEAVPTEISSQTPVVKATNINPLDTGYTLTGLVKGAAYTLYLYEYNVEGPSSPATASVIIPSAAHAPSVTNADVTATPGNGSVTLSWQPATPANGETIAGYSVTYGPTDSNATQTVVVSNFDANLIPVTTTISGLTNGTQYSFVVHAFDGSIGDTNAEVSYNQVQATPESASTGGGGNGSGGGGGGGGVTTIVITQPAPSTAPTTTTVSTAPSVSPAIVNGYHTVGSDGGVFSFGAAFGGSLGNISLNKPIVGGALDQGKNGAYWLVASDGGVFSLGGAQFYGSAAELGGVQAKAPVVGMAATSDGGGYILVDNQGNVYNFGDAQNFGGLGNMHLNAPIVGVAMTPDNKGYWLFAADGGVFAFGDATYYGSMGGKHLNQPIVGGAATPDGKGYYLVAADGGIFTFGDAQYFGSTGAMTLNAPIVGMKVDPSGGGYYLFAKDGGVFTFGNAPFDGSAANLKLNGPIVGGF